MINYVVIFLMVVGVIFFFAAVVGINRFPGFYSRMHAASKGDTLSSLCFLLGFALYVGQDLTLASMIVALKILIILVFIFIASPTATHALVEAAYWTGTRPNQALTKNVQDEEEIKGGENDLEL